MAVAKSNRSIKSLIQPFNCYKVSNITETLLGSNCNSNLKDRYVLGEQLGLGQFGIIRKCADKFTGDVLACKSIAKDRLATQEDVQSVKLEIEIMTKLSGHPNVVDLKAVYEEEEYVHLVMELCAGGELFGQLEKHGRFSENKARILFRDLMEVVMYCHENRVVHRDLKPENILLTTKASSSPIKLADFGLATYIKPGQSLNGTVGSPFYIAPEVLAGGYNQAADVWSAGVILFILLSGVPPFWGKTKSQIFDAVRAADLRFPSDPWDQLSESSNSLVRGMLHIDPSKRLTAQKVLDHPWMLGPEHSELFGANQLHSCGNGSSADFMSRNLDVSFGVETPAPTVFHSPSFTCRSSFSSFLVEPVESTKFSFHVGERSMDLEFSPPAVSMPSFSFLGPQPVLNPKALRLYSIPGETTLGGLVSSWVEGRGRSGVKTLGVHSKRNRTIGVGELEQLDLMVTESVIRWASCTDLPTAPSLQSSLVC